MSKIQLGMKGLAKYMTSGAAAQRKVLRDYKFPDEQGAAQAMYYREAKDAIRAYHSGSHDQDWLVARAKELEDNASTLSGTPRSRLNNNVRAIRDYARHFHKKKYSIIAGTRFSLEYSGVIILVTPDLIVSERETKRMLKFDFSQTPVKSGVVKIITQAMLQAALLNEFDIASKDNLYVHLSSGESHRGARVASRTLRDIEGACATIATIWPTIQKDDRI